MYDCKNYKLDNEIWVPIKNYEGIYEASSFGRVRSVEGKKTRTERHGVRTWKGRIIKPRGNTYKTGYKVSLWNNGNQKDFLVARVVCESFHGTPNQVKTNERITVNHIDGNRFNNEVSNLEWLSLSDNIRHAFETGLVSTQKAVTLYSEDGTKEFRSLSLCDRYLNRSVGYCSLRLSRGKETVLSIEKEEYIALAQPF